MLLSVEHKKNWNLYAVCVSFYNFPNNFLFYFTKILVHNHLEICLTTDNLNSTAAPQMATRWCPRIFSQTLFARPSMENKDLPTLQTFPE